MSTKSSSTKHQTARYVFDSDPCSSVDPRAPRQRVRMVSIKTNDAFKPGFKGTKNGTECKIFRHTLGGSGHEDNAEVTERLIDGAKILQSKMIQEEEVQRHIDYDSAMNLKASQKNPRIRERIRLVTRRTDEDVSHRLRMQGPTGMRATALPSPTREIPKSTPPPSPAYMPKNFNTPPTSDDDSSCFQSSPLRKKKSSPCQPHDSDSESTLLSCPIKELEMLFSSPEQPINKACSKVPDDPTDDMTEDPTEAEESDPIKPALEDESHPQQFHLEEEPMVPDIQELLKDSKKKNKKKKIKRQQQQQQQQNPPHVSLEVFDVRSFLLPEAIPEPPAPEPAAVPVPKRAHATRKPATPRVRAGYHDVRRQSAPFRPGQVPIAARRRESTISKEGTEAPVTRTNKMILLDPVKITKTRIYENDN